MDKDARDLVERLHREEIERIQAGGAVLSSARPPRQVEGLPEAEPGNPMAAEWELFRSEVESLIRNGCKGRFAVVKVGHPITAWDTLRDALQAAELLYGKEMVLIQEIQRYLPPRLRLVGDRSCRD
jgi:hypothetical protein